MRLRRNFFKTFFTSTTWWLGLTISLILSQFAAQMVEEKNKIQFDFQTNNARLAIEARIHSHVEVLRATRAMFHASDNVTRQAFHSYVTDLDLPNSFPGITRLSFAPLVLDRDKAAFESSVRSDRSIDTNGSPEFVIKPAGSRPEYHVLTYLEPMAGNRAHFGFDLASHPRGEEALALSRDSGELISSYKPMLNIDGQQNHTALTLQMPLYRQGMPLNTASERHAAFYGSVGAGFDISKLMLDAIDKNTLPGMRLKLYDLGRNDEYVPTGTSDPGYLLFDNIAMPESRLDRSPAVSVKDFFIKRTSMTVGSHMWEIEFSTPKNTMLIGIDAYFPWLLLAGGVLGSLLVYGNYDSLLTARRHAMELANDMTKDLRASKADLAEAQHMAMLGSWLLDPDTGSMTWSDETYRIFRAVSVANNPGYADFLAHIDEHDRERIQQGLESSIRTGFEFNTEHRIVRPDGSIRWVQMITRSSNIGPKRLLRGTIMDITDRRHNLEALKRSQELLRELTAHQDRIKEVERKRIAREIHDELGQTLLALRLDVAMLDIRTAESHPKLNDRVRGMLQHIDATVKSVRAIINNLRPAVLDLGLSAAVEWQVNQFRRRSAIACELVMDSNEFTLSDAPATTLFRILQESLANVIRHANATEVRVDLYDDGSNLVMKITDNGIGIDPDDRNKADSFGLVGIEERVLALGGKFRIDSAPALGTTLTIFIPLQQSIRAKLKMFEE
ncbi:MAG: hypothetical protein A3I66_03745 [Burkholderiales bacterium RIFCSPLOWO2_02_FULL_57_36]|nr:MAG: hypothetical protein A3I66_03745 [Burkholderiales bacterium RIFCSPLOWO2_02_FULL_57_36]